MNKIRITMLLTCVALAAALLVSGCGLARDNPLDPNANPTIYIPETISNLHLYASPPNAQNKYVELSWEANPSYSTDGYYVYRSLGYYATFARVDTVFTNSASHGSKSWHYVAPGEYYYKVSAFKDYPGGRLEGRACQPVWVYVPN